MIRLGVDARPLHYPRTGIGQYTKNILSHLSKTPDIELYLYARDPLPEMYQGPNARHSTLRGLPNSLHAQILFPLWGLEDRLDVFWSPRHHLPLAIRCPCVVTIHDMVWVKHPQTMTGGGATLERLLMPLSIRKAKSIICVSDATRLDLEQHVPDAAAKCDVIYEAACQVPDGTLYNQPEHPFFLFVGTKEPRKNLETCLRAWKQSGLADAGYKLAMAGGKGWNVDLSKLIERFALQDSVLDLEPNSEELRELYATCRAVVLPSVYEGFGLPLVEAMAFGKPMITSNVSSMPEIAGDAAILVTPTNVEQIADAFSELATDNRLLAALAEKSRLRSKRFDWETSAKATLEIIRTAASYRQSESRIV